MEQDRRGRQRNEENEGESKKVDENKKSEGYGMSITMDNMEEE